MVSNSIMDPLVVLGRRGRKRNVNLNPEKREKLDKKNHAAKLKRLQNGQGTGARVKGINSPVKDNCVSDRTKSIRVTNECIKEGQSSCVGKTNSGLNFPCEQNFPFAPPNLCESPSKVGIPSEEILRASEIYHTELSHALRSKLEAIKIVVEERNAQNISPVAVVQENTESWRGRVAATTEQWDRERISLKNAAIRSVGCSHSQCFRCKTSLGAFQIICYNCKQHLCPACDQSVHFSSPFHQRKITFSNKSCLLLPNNFVDETGSIYQLDVPVPCFTPSSCSTCQSLGEIALVAGSRNVIVVNKDGRFDLKSAVFCCKKCNVRVDATTEDYVASQLWPGVPGISIYFFDFELLDLWRQIRNHCPGTSLRKFVESLEGVSSSSGRVSTINRYLFGRASNEYEYHIYVIEDEILERKIAYCDSCGDDPLAAVADGNFKLPRYEKNQPKEGADRSLYEGAIIAIDKDVDKHIKLIDDEIPPSNGRNDCGGNVFKAATDHAARLKKQDERGLTMLCCRHGCVLRAVNMFKGETYRHIHYLHKFAFEKNCKFLCYDVVCQYWLWARKVGDTLGHKYEDFKSMTTLMFPFLSRMHAIAHVWYCYILWVGHWQSGAGGTIGEEMEQVNSTMSRHGNVTKHMTRAGRRDHLTSTFIFWNASKDQKMTKMLCNRLVRAKILYPAYTQELETILLKNKWNREDIEPIYNSLIQLATDANTKKTRGKEHVDFNMRCLECIFVEMTGQQKLFEKSAVGSHARVQATAAISKTKGRAEKLIKVINSEYLKKNYQILEDKLENQNVSADLTNPKESASQVFLQVDSTPGVSVVTSQQNLGKEKAYITMEDFLSGIFPWQTGDKDDYKNKHFLIDTWMLMLRYKEEIKITENEMAKYVSSKETKLQQLSLKIDNLAQDSASQCESEKQFMRGQILLIEQEMQHLKQLLRNTVKQFQRSLDTSPNDHVDDQLNDESDEEVLDEIDVVDSEHEEHTN